jgi:nanoRNase/pAp phosphatase (c-di-AMP/oligoRNAs hydrolase)
LIKNEKVVYIQTHNFPDHDAVGTAFGLQHLLIQYKIASRIIYEGDIQRDSLLEFIAHLKIDIRHASQYPIQENDKIIIVDGCKGNKNVADLPGQEVAVIDHHRTISPDDVPYIDIRPEYGSCSSVIYSYFAANEIEIPFRVATALLAGLLMDTSLMIRGVCEHDLNAYAQLYHLADNLFVNRNLRNSIQVKDLSFYRNAIDRVIIRNSIAFCYFQEGCNQNLLGIIGDFFLAVKEVEFVFLCAKNENSINFSLRNENPRWNSAQVIQEILRGIGFGGGHNEMAGGIIRDSQLFNEQAIYNKLTTLLT